MARCARSLDKLLAQLNAMAPVRSIASDGWIGDPSHQNRTSDHNPWVPPGVGGIVTARDFTHDPERGADMHDFTEALRLSRDPRIKYVIWDADDATGMFSSYAAGGIPPFTWRRYTGPNLHTAHAHVSVQPTAYLYDSSKAWDIQGKDWFDMADAKDLERIVRQVVREEIKELAVGSDQKDWNSKHINLKDVEQRIRAERSK